MIDVLSRLAALDADNPTINNPLAAGKKHVVEGEQVAQLPALEDMSTLRALSGLKPVAECGMMGSPMPMEHHTPASFSINASAGSGDEVAGMLSQIMNLAGVHKVGPEHMPNIDSGARPMIAEPPEKDIMRSAMDAMNDPEPEDESAGAPEADTNNAMMALPAPGAEAGTEEGGQAEPGTAEPMQSAADEIRNMADRLADIEDKDELNLETYDNTPNSPHSDPQYDNDKMSFNPNAGGFGGNGLANNPRAFAEDLESKLFAEYQQFVSESEQKTMSKAAKGMMKYGKEGMKALAKAGKDGKDLDKVRAKYDKYD